MAETRLGLIIPKRSVAEFFLQWMKSIAFIRQKYFHFAFLTFYVDTLVNKLHIVNNNLCLYALSQRTLIIDIAFHPGKRKTSASQSIFI